MFTNCNADSINEKNLISNHSSAWYYKSETRPHIPKSFVKLNRIFNIMFFCGVIYVSLFLFYLMCFIAVNVSSAFLAAPALFEYMSTSIFKPIVIVIGFLFYIVGYIGHRFTYFYLHEENYLLHGFTMDNNGKLFYIYFNDLRFLNYFNLQAYAPFKLKNENYIKNPTLSQETKDELRRQNTLLFQINEQNIMVFVCENHLHDTVGNLIHRIIKVKEQKNHFQLSFTVPVKNKKGSMVERKHKIRIYNNICSYNEFLNTCNNIKQSK